MISWEAVVVRSREEKEGELVYHYTAAIFAQAPVYAARRW